MRHYINVGQHGLAQNMYVNECMFGGKGETWPFMRKLITIEYQLETIVREKCN